MSKGFDEHSTASRDNLLGSSFPCECGRVHTIPVRKIVLERGAYQRLPEVLEGLSLPRDACVVADENTFQVLGEKVVQLLSSRNYGVREVVLGTREGRSLKADEATAEELLSSLPSVPLLVAVGSGTINDLTKFAADKRRVPYVVLPTAPTLNGYTSSIVALTVGGLKMTLEAPPPIAVVADLNVLVEAPMELITSGLGDILSKPVSTADWKLAQVVNGEYFCLGPIKLVEEFEPYYMNNPERIRLRQPDAIRALTEALLYSGISMIIAGSSSPGSGGEHLISHTLDMQADLAGREHGYHGTQVGIATIFTAALYEKIMKEDISSLDVDSLVAGELSPAQHLAGLSQYWGPYADGVAKELSSKLSGRREKRRRLRAIQEKWQEIAREIRPFLRPSCEIAEILRKGGAATRIAEIGLSLEQFRQAVLHAREMRRRYTILDLAHDFGVLERHHDASIRETGLWAG